MAIDTADRRASTIAGGLGFLVILPEPDGLSISAPDRAHLAGLYRGIDAPAPDDGIPARYRFAAGRPVRHNIPRAGDPIIR